MFALTRLRCGAARRTAARGGRRVLVGVHGVGRGVGELAVGLADLDRANVHEVARQRRLGDGEAASLRGRPASSAWEWMFCDSRMRRMSACRAALVAGTDWVGAVSAVITGPPAT